MQGPQGEQEDAAAPHEGATVLSGWIREMLDELDTRQLRRIAQLQDRLNSEIFLCDSGPLAQTLQAVYVAGREIHFPELRTGLLQRVLGRHRAAFHHFAEAVDRVEAGIARLKEHMAEVAVPFKEHSAVSRRVFMELDVECKEVATEVDRGLTWLQQMCEDINQHRNAGSGDRKLAAMAEAAQTYTLKFKQLQSVGSMVRDIGVRGQAILERRTALLAQVRAETEAFDRQWSLHVGDVATAVRAGHTNLPGIPQAMQAHEDAMKRLDAALDACGALQGEEQFLAEQLQALRATLAEAGPAD